MKLEDDLEKLKTPGLCTIILTRIHDILDIALMSWVFKAEWRPE
jgi:hypothetical protein